ncbi:hypothetical protein [Actinopolyspora mortivallis]|uniref:ATP synthase subunit I n=1 Tax=Actinopolyspora mortivallis TaxID=33906 RepID=A0A2T0GZU3_ACTMO|nr:hypothetical protein [Actinopolyspora mortivallis]PRW64631.1 hypothetical protein CEP50_04580 [Actinopolyspora mortivallis]
MSEATGAAEDAARTAEVNPHGRAVRRLADAMLRTAAWPAVVTVLVSVVVAAFWVGAQGALGALIGGVIASASSLLTLWLMRMTSDSHPMFVMVAALGGYIGKMLVLFAVVTLLRVFTAVHVPAVAIAILATVLVWTFAEVRAFRRTRIPTIALANDS